MTTASLSRITRKQIKTRVGEASFLKGQSYAADGSVFDTKRRGQTLKARVQGRRFEPYRVSIQCDEAGIASSECSCPVGGGGYCKHVAAVLMVWVDQPDLFLEVEDLNATLESWSKEELVGLIHRMLRRSPELEILLETPSPTARGRVSGKARTADFHRRQAETAFRLAGNDWRASYGVAQDLSAIRSLGDDLLGHDDLEAAEAVYEGALTGILRQYGTIQDEEGEIGVVASECGEGLGKCLARERDPDRRLGLLRALFDFYRFDVGQGGYGFADEVPGILVEHAQDDERKTVAGWIREVLAGIQERDLWRGDYRRRVWGAFLLDLEGDTLDDEAYLRTCRETGRTIDAIERLLDRNRIVEAQDEAAGLPTAETLTAADLFLHRKQGEWAEQFVEARADDANDPAMLEWLQRRALSRKDRASALGFARRAFRLSPSLEGYQEVHKLAGAKRWPTVRDEVLAELEAMGRDALRVEIALDEKDHQRAVEMVGAHGRNDLNWLVVRVADAAAESKPEAAIALYRREVEHLIDRQGRTQYRDACRLIAKVRKLHLRLQDKAGWTTYRDDLLARNRRLRAFREEFQAAKLDR